MAETMCFLVAAKKHQTQKPGQKYIMIFLYKKIVQIQHGIFLG